MFSSSLFVLLLAAAACECACTVVDYNRLLSYDDYQAAAKTKLDQFTYAYMFNGSQSEFTLRRNRDAFSQFLIRPNYLRNVSQISTRTNVLGMDLEWPVGTAPQGMLHYVHAEGEVGMARAAEAEGSVFGHSNYATATVEHLAENVPNANKWFQLYIFKNKSLDEALIRRAENSGYKAIFILLDSPRSAASRSWHKQNFMNNFDLSGKVAMFNSTDIGPAGVAVDNAANINDIRAIVQMTRLPVIAKGIVTVEGALMAKEAGCKGIVISTHGGRQLDGSPSPIEVLPHIVAALGPFNKMAIMIDSGFTQGSDVFRALGLGAQYVFLGKASRVALALGGEMGARKMLQMIKGQLRETMELAGCATIKDISRYNVVHENYYKKLY